MATTALLERLKDKKFDIKAWLVEDVIRIFGIGACLRDESRDLNKKQIIKALKKEDKRRTKEREEVLNAKYPTLLVERKLKKEYKKAKKTKEKELWKLLNDKEQTLKCIEEFNDIYRTNISKEELVVNLLRTAKEQLAILKDDINFDIKWYKKTLKSHFSSFEKFKEWKEKEIKEEIRHMENRKKELLEEDITESYVEVYKKLLDAIYPKK